MTFSVDLLPLMPQRVDEGDALVGGHLSIGLAVGFIRLGERIEFPDSNIPRHIVNYTAET